IFDMISTKISNNEIDKLCEVGFCGEFPLIYGLSGNGIGMFRVKKLLNMNAACINIKNNVLTEEAIIENGFKYENNQFIVILKECKKKNRKNIILDYS
nr:hypothetical protein [Candidatus Cloacimonadota bacterium]